MTSKIRISVLSGIVGMALSAASTAEAAPILHYGYSAPVYEGSYPPVLLSGGLQTGTIDETGFYRVTVAGASGGAGIEPGGIGALVDGEIFLQAGVNFTVLVGGDGQSDVTYSYGGGGGGMSFFWLEDADVLAVAGGGGGGGGNYFSVIGLEAITSPGSDGMATQAGSGGKSLFEATGGSGGVNGMGGGAGSFFDGSGSFSEPRGGGGGAGFKGNGGGWDTDTNADVQPQRFAGQTGPTWLGSAWGSDGGFGGGGGGNELGGGGGGGYSGGGGGGAGILAGSQDYTSVGLGGGGGGSFLSPIFKNPSLVTGGATDGAYVSLELLALAEPPKPIPLPATAALLAAALAALAAAARLRGSQS